MWTIELAGHTPVTLNSRAHWSKRSAAARAYRDSAHLAARAARIPRLERVSVRLDVYPPDNRRRDPDNYVPVLKAAVDGLRDANVIDDDTARYVERAFPILHPSDGVRAWRFKLTVEPVPVAATRSA